MKLNQGAYEMILRGRHPAAVAKITGESSSLSGDVAFYCTPLGVVVCASVLGIPQKKNREVFDFSMDNDCRTPIPSLYAESGSAWCAVMTGNLRIADLLGKTLSLCRRNRTALGAGRIVIPEGMEEIS